MNRIEGNCCEVFEATEFIAIVTQGDDGPHVVGNWGDYLRTVGIREDKVVLPAGRYQQTERNLAKDNRIQVMVASKSVAGTRTPGQGYVVAGTGRIESSGQLFDAVKAKFPWARGALVIDVQEVKAHL
jgi:hypothetical protein